MPQQTSISGFIRNRSILLSLIALSLATAEAAAVQWQPLARTARHEVAFDQHSIRLTPLGRMAVWLRFVPLGERQRVLAAAEYGEKSYRLHLEYYEIDCSEKSAVLQLVDIIGAEGKRLARIRGGGRPDPIAPGSSLDLAARNVCPLLEEQTADDDSAAPDAGTPAEQGAAPPEENRNRISEAVRKTESDPNNPAAWRDLGNAYYDADMPNEAIEAYNRALAFTPDDADILNDQGAMYRQAGNITQALANFERALSIAPYNLESLYNLGYILAFDLKRMDKALEAWRRYLQLDKTSDTARQVQGFIERYDR
jgi:tetratricopeptide (TPR) repeat protein